HSANIALVLAVAHRNQRFFARPRIRSPIDDNTRRSGPGEDREWKRIIQSDAQCRRQRWHLARQHHSGPASATASKRTGAASFPDGTCRTALPGRLCPGTRRTKRGGYGAPAGVWHAPECRLSTGRALVLY